MKINHKILSIPPYVSTSWKNVISLHMEQTDIGPTLIVGLLNGAKIAIPNLEKPILEEIFSAHQKYLEQDNSSSENTSSEKSIFASGFMNDNATTLNLPFKFGLDGGMNNLLQHNPEAANSPDLPKDMLEKIAALSKVAGLENVESFPKPEPHCNCMYCQIMRSIHDNQKNDSEDNEKEEEISDGELKFREWDIEQTGENLYIVSNPFNCEEQFNVFLGEPIGCTCGKLKCEHICAVLNS